MILSYILVHIKYIIRNQNQRLKTLLIDIIHFVLTFIDEIMHFTDEIHN